MQKIESDNRVERFYRPIKAVGYEIVRYARPNICSCNSRGTSVHYKLPAEYISLDNPSYRVINARSIGNLCTIWGVRLFLPPTRRLTVNSFVFIVNGTRNLQNHPRCQPWTVFFDVQMASYWSINYKIAEIISTKFCFRSCDTVTYGSSVILIFIIHFWENWTH